MTPNVSKPSAVGGLTPGRPPTVKALLPFPTFERRAACFASINMTRNLGVGFGDSPKPSSFTPRITVFIPQVLLMRRTLTNVGQRFQPAHFFFFPPNQHL
jgi:hypothetical protein